MTLRANCLSDSYLTVSCLTVSCLTVSRATLNTVSLAMWRSKAGHYRLEKPHSQDQHQKRQVQTNRPQRQRRNDASQPLQRWVRDRIDSFDKDKDDPTRSPLPGKHPDPVNDKATDQSVEKQLQDKTKNKLHDA